MRGRPTHCCRLALVVLFGLSLIGCEGLVAEREVPPQEWPDVLEELPWPDAWEELPACEYPWTGPFEAPETEEPSGLLRLFAEGLQPMHRDLVMHVEVLAADGAVDGGFDDAFFLDVQPSQGFEIQSISEPVSGRLSVRYRLTEPGIYTLNATVENSTRTGSTQIAGYETNLPIWEIQTSPEDWESLIAGDPAEYTRVPVTLVLEGVSYAAQMRLHGGSTRWYAKKSWRIDLEADETGDSVELPDGSDHLVLRAEYPDKTMLRNYLSSQMLRSGTWVPASRVEPVHLRVNGEFYGLMQRAERIDGDFLASRGLNNDGQLYEADPPHTLLGPGGNLTPLDPDLYEQVYQHHRGPIEYTDLIELIEQTLSPGGVDAEQPIADSVAVGEVLAYAAVEALIQNQDHLRKNYYLYRDAAASDEGGWRFLPWDMDLTWGHLWSEENDILGEEITTDASLWMGLSDTPEAWNHNALLHRVLREPVYAALFEEYVLHLMNDVFSEEFVEERIDNMLCRTTPELLADTKKRADNAEYLDRVDELFEFLDGKRDQVWTEFGGE